MLFEFKGTGEDNESVGLLALDDLFLIHGYYYNLKSTCQVEESSIYLSIYIYLYF